MHLDSDFYISDPRFSINNSDEEKEKEARLWFKRMWQFQVHNQSRYSVYSDSATTNAGNNQFSGGVNFTEEDTIAQDPLNRLFLIALGSLTDESQRYQGVDILEEYGVTLTMANCGTGRHVMFDYLGRPHCFMNAAYPETNPYGMLMASQLVVTLTLDTNTRQICIEPITGYIHEC